MKKLMVILLTITFTISCGGFNAFAAGNMSSWFTSSTAETMQIIDADENLGAFDERINSIMILYGIYNYLGEANVDLSNVEAPFADMGNFEPYSMERKAITWLYLKGILKGYDDGTVKPKSQITRAEYVSLLVRMLENTNSMNITTKNNPYKDIDGHWAYTNILKATSLGLVQGDGTSFNPNNWITKEEVITIGLRLADNLELDINEYADIVDEIYAITIDYPIYTDGFGRYDYSQYDYVINVGSYEKVYFPGISSISSYNTSKTGIVTVNKYTGYLNVTGKSEGVVTITAVSNSGYRQSLKVLVTDESNSNNSYTVRIGSTQKVYHPNRTNIKSYSITSGSSYITVTKNTNYLSVKGIKAGTAKIKITDIYGDSKTVIVKAGSSSNSNNGFEDGYYYATSGETIRVYPTSGRNISSYYISSGSSRVNVTKNTSYLSVYCRNNGTAIIRITDTYGDTEAITIDINSNFEENGYDYGLTETLYLDKGDYTNLYFNYLDNIEGYDLSSGTVSVTKYSTYIRVYAKNTGSVTITGYDYYGNTERKRIIVNSSYEEDIYDYGVTNTESIYNNDEVKIYFENLEGDLVDYDVSETGIINVELRDNYLIVRGRSGRTGTITLTAYDEYGSSEGVRIKVYDSNDNDSDDSSQPPYRPIIYPPDYEIDISK